MWRMPQLATWNKCCTCETFLFGFRAVTLTTLYNVFLGFRHIDFVGQAVLELYILHLPLLNIIFVWIYSYLPVCILWYSISSTTCKIESNNRNGNCICHTWNLISLLNKMFDSIYSHPVSLMQTVCVSVYVINYH